MTRLGIGLLNDSLAAFIVLLGFLFRAIELCHTIRGPFSIVMQLEGGCLCGDIRYKVSGELSKDERPSLCHCRICQRAAGAPVVGWATFNEVCVQHHVVLTAISMHAASHLS